MSKRYGAIEAVSHLDLVVPTGVCFGLLGPNGAGKTTTVEILEGLNTPTAGDVATSSLARFAVRGEGDLVVLRDWDNRGPRESARRNG